jgi:DNA repair exonuclease SbcCD ATPase subunit
MRASDRVHQSLPHCVWRGTRNLALMALLAIVAGSPLALAQDAKKDAREREAMRRLQAAQTELQRVTKERDQLASEREESNARVKKAEQAAGSARAAAGADQRRLTDELGALRAELDAQRKVNETSLRQNAELSEQIRTLSRQLDTAQTQGRDLDAQLQQRTSEGKRVAQELLASRRSFAQCEAQADKLHAFGLDLLDQFGKVGVLDVVRRNEPVFGLRRVELENLMETYRDRLQAARSGSGPR